MSALIFLVIIASLSIGFLLGIAVRAIEDKEWNRANSKTMTPPAAPGADWGTWSPTTNSPKPTWLGVGHSPDGEQW